MSDRVIISLKNAITLAYNATFHRHKKFVGDNLSDSYYFFWCPGRLILLLFAFNLFESFDN